MNFISLGIHCVVADGIGMTNRRLCSYPFDWLWCPAKTTYNILERLIAKSPDLAADFMVTGGGFYDYIRPEYFVSVDHKTMHYMNQTTGLGIVHDSMDDEYRNKLIRRLVRLLDCVRFGDETVFIYSDATNSDLNYHLNGVEFGVDATEHLCDIYDLLSLVNPNITILYFCWASRIKESEKIKHIVFISLKENVFLRPTSPAHQQGSINVREVIRDYLNSTY